VLGNSFFLGSPPLVVFGMGVLAILVVSTLG
jgi:hypothetical protein